MTCSTTAAFTGAGLLTAIRPLAGGMDRGSKKLSIVYTCAALANCKLLQNARML